MGTYSRIPDIYFSVVPNQNKPKYMPIFSVHKMCQNIFFLNLAHIRTGVALYEHYQFLMQIELHCLCPNTSIVLWALIFFKPLLKANFSRNLVFFCQHCCFAGILGSQRLRSPIDVIFMQNSLVAHILRMPILGSLTLHVSVTVLY